MKNKHKRIILIASTAVILILFIVYLSIAFYFRTHFFYGSAINSIDSGGKTVSDVEEAIHKEIKDYIIQIDGRNQLTDIITAEDIDYEYVSDGSVAALLKEQNCFAWIASLFNKKASDMQVTTTYDKKKLANKINNLTFFDPKNVTVPIDASVEYNANTEKYEIVAEDNGTTILKDVLTQAITNVLESGDTYINLEDAECYQKPAYTSNSTELTTLLATLNKYIAVTITYDFGDQYEICDKAYIQDWLEVDDKFQVSLNLEKIRTYIDSIARIHNTYGKTRDFVNHDGKIIEVSGGDYGWLLDRATETTRLAELIKEGKNVQIEPTYSQTARSRTVNDIGDSYIEIDLTLQHVWVYKDGNLVVDMDCVTGNSRRGFDTPTGIYQITYKERDATLKGENYSSAVKYWMPFYYNVGLHDASWRNSFGGDIYKTSGSHGCVNLPPKIAETIFQNIEKGTPVVVYASKEKAKSTNTDSKERSDKREQTDSSKPTSTETDSNSLESISSEE